MKHDLSKTISCENCKEDEVSTKSLTGQNTDLNTSTTDLTNSNLDLCKNDSLSCQSIPSKQNHNNEKSNIKKKIFNLFSNITVEPILCFYTFPQLLSQIAISNLQFQTACRVNLGFNETICDDILRVNNSEYEMLVQKEAAKLMVWKKPVSTLVPALLILFIGSFSDRFKIRKPFLIIPLISEVLISICMLICTYYQSVVPMEIVAGSEAFFIAITGGFTTVKIAVYSYVCDISSIETRTKHIGIVQILSSIMTPIASALSGILFNTTKFYGVFTIRTFIFVVGVMYGILVLKEVKSNSDEIRTSRSIYGDFFDLNHVKSTFKTLVRKRENMKRMKIFLVLSAFVVMKGASSGEMEFMFLYTRLKFQWDEITYGFYITYDTILRLLGSALAVTIFTQLLKLDDLIVVPIALTSKIIGSCIWAFCPSETYFYTASVISLLTDYQTVPIRSLATKLVDVDELGKIQSLLGLCEAIAPSIYVPLYSAVYRASVDYFPGAIFLTGAGSMLPIIPIFLLLYFLKSENDTSEDCNIRNDRIKYIIPINDL